jgi:hypothetical protein
MPKQPPTSQQARQQNLKPLPTNTRKPAQKSPTRLCACGCGDQVVARMERRHLEGKVRPSVFAKRKVNAIVHPTSPEPDDDIPGLLSKNDSNDEENAYRDSDVDMDLEVEEDIVAKVPMVLRGAMEALKDLPAQEDDIQGSGNWGEADVFGGSEVYQDNPARLSTCPLTLHSLLHIADGIEFNGPVWASWAFPMEQYCCKLQPAFKSCRHPFACLDKHVAHVTQLSQIKLRYNLFQELSLKERHGPRRGAQIFSHKDCMLFLSAV